MIEQARISYHNSFYVHERCFPFGLFLHNLWLKYFSFLPFPWYHIDSQCPEMTNALPYAALCYHRSIVLYTYAFLFASDVFGCARMPKGNLVRCGPHFHGPLLRCPNGRCIARPKIVDDISEGY